VVPFVRNQVNTLGHYYYYYYLVVFHHRLYLSGSSPLEPTVIPTAQASSFRRLQYSPYYVWCSKYSYLLWWIYWMFSWCGFEIFISIITHFMFHICCVSVEKFLYFSFAWQSCALVLLRLSLCIFFFIVIFGLFAMTLLCLPPALVILFTFVVLA